jgi:succinoglycan biosynthesis transport protein ExoP
VIREAPAPDNSAPGLNLNFLGLFALLRRERGQVARIVAAALALSLAYAIFAPRSYLSSADILVSARPKDILAASPGADALTGLVDPGLIESQVEILKSSSVLLAVVRKLDLLDDDGFMGRQRWNPLAAIRDAVASLFRPASSGDSHMLAEQWAVKAIADRLKVRRVGMTYVVDVAYSGLTPDLAYKIVRGLSEEYIEGELRARYDNSRRATDWFRGRLLDLEKDVADADHEVQRYRAQNNIVDTSRGRLDEEQLSNMSVQLAGAEATTAQAKAVYERASAIAGADLADSGLPEALKSDAVSKLREKYVRLAAKRRELAARFGVDHQLVAEVGREGQDTARAAREEIHRIVEADRNELEIALSREGQLRANIQKLVARFAEVNDSQVALRKLESDVKVYRNVYDASLEKFQLNAQAQAAPMEIARVITPAIFPDRPAWPRTSWVLLAGLALGGLVSVSIVLAQEALYDRFRGPQDVRDHAGLPCLGVLPRLGAADLPVVAPGKALGAHTPIMRITVTDPFSPFAKAVRDVKVSIDLARPPGEAVTIGIISTRGGEGKTTLAANLAFLTAKMGRRTLLIDGDLHSFRLTATLAPAARAGLLQALASPGERADFCTLDPATGLRFLPAVASGRIFTAAEILRSRSMERTLASARAEFDYVFVDLPALQSDIDARAAAALFDGFVYVIESGATRRRELREALWELAPARGRIVGAVLNKATPDPKGQGATG